MSPFASLPLLERPTIYVFPHDVACGQRGFDVVGERPAAGHVLQDVFERVRVRAQGTGAGEGVVEVHFPHLLDDPLHPVREEDGEDGGFTCGRRAGAVSERTDGRRGGRGNMLGTHQ